ncbi:MAG TPA: TonB-dependent receptor [Vicinamibacterales bacterium]|jgi:hemoglobin/transferrin/lactoferrin receptor protein
MSSGASRLHVTVAVVCLIVLSASLVLAESSVSGVVKDSSGAVVARASVSLVTAEQRIVAAGSTDAAGRFTFPDIRPGRYLLIVSSPGFGDVRQAVVAGAAGLPGLAITLQPQPVREDVTVTASRGTVQQAAASVQAVTVIDANDIASRAHSVVAQAVSEESGVNLLRTSPTMAGIYVRGLTGNKVSVYVDGVRYSTSAARGGVSTFLDLIEPTSLQAIEILRGPNSAQYGSDAIGGSVQFLSKVPTFATADEPRVHGAVALNGGTADWSGGANVSAGYSRGQLGIFANLAARRINDIRTGEGIDSHAAVTRFLGISSNRLMDAHLPDTAFTQYGGLVRLNWAPTPDQQLMAFYSRAQQDDGKRYDQLLGGDGNLVADLRNLMLDLFYVKYQRTGLGWFDQATITYSFNSQREERVNQGGNGNPRGSITHEFERTNAHGFQANATRRLKGRHDILIGGEFYPERIHAPSFSFNPVTQASATRRGRVPDHAAYRSDGAYVQDSFDAIPGRLQVVGNLRYSYASYESLAADRPLIGGKPLWPNDSLSVSNLTFRAGVVAKPGREGLTLTASVSRGFRAPHVTDLGTLGLTGSGFQVSASSVQGMNATVGTTAGSTAVSTGQPVEQLGPETSLSYDGGLHLRTGRFSTDLSAFINDVSDNIAYQALILPQGAVGKSLGDQPIMSQNANGAVFVSASSSPVLVRTNVGDARIYGVEHTLDWRLSRALSIGTVFTYLHAADRSTGLPPNIEGGTPAADAYVRVRYMQPGGRWFVEPYLHAAATQGRLSSLDLEDRRTGATRSRSNIKNFFYNGATARGWVGTGPDGIAGTADDVLLITGETLAQIQARVLGVGVDSAPLVTEVPGYVTVGVRAALTLATRHEVTLQVENIGDRNYRGIAWGIDAPGINLVVGWRARF